MLLQARTSEWNLKFDHHSGVIIPTISGPVGQPSLCPRSARLSHDQRTTKIYLSELFRQVLAPLLARSIDASNWRADRETARLVTRKRVPTHVSAFSGDDAALICQHASLLNYLWTGTEGADYSLHNSVLWNRPISV